MEGVAFSLRDTLSIFAELEVPVERIRLGGGGSRSAVWRQIQADVYGQPVDTAADEGAAYGAAILAAVGIDRWPTVDAACDALVRGTTSTQPRAAAVTSMSDRYRAYRRSIPRCGMSMPDRYSPRPEHKFSFGLWTVGNRGRDPFGDVVRDPLPPVDAVALLAEVGAWGVNLHDNDLVPIDASPSDRDRIVTSFKAACNRHGIVVPMATVNLFYDPVFRDGAFTSNDSRSRVRAGEDQAGDGPWRGARRQHLRAVGRT
jgi:Sugar (pentulose and hexulose) kinases